MMIQPTPMHCAACAADFTAELVMNAPVDVAVASMNAVRCPSCGKGPRGILLGRNPKPATSPPATHQQPTTGES